MATPYNLVTLPPTDSHFERHAAEALDRLLANLRTHLERSLTGFTHELVRAAVEDRTHATSDAAAMAAADVHRQVEEQLSELRENAQRQTADVRRTAEAQVAELRAALEQQVNVIARVTHQKRDVASRLAEAIRALDRGRRLRDVLDALGEWAAREAPRTAVLVVGREVLLGWHLSNFEPASEDPRALRIPLSEAGIAGTVARTGRPAAGLFTPSSGADGSTLPSFARSETSRHALAYPITVARQVVGVLYGDSPASAVPSPNAEWPAILEVLGRHSSCVLEAILVRHAVDVGTPRAPAPSSTR